MQYQKNEGYSKWTLQPVNKEAHPFVQGIHAFISLTSLYLRHRFTFRFHQRQLDYFDCQRRLKTDKKQLIGAVDNFLWVAWLLDNHAGDLLHVKTS